MKNFKLTLKLQLITFILKLQQIIEIWYKTAPFKNTWGNFGHVEIFKKIEYIWTFEYTVMSIKKN
jgi:hypothetical protein